LHDNSRFLKSSDFPNYLSIATIVRNEAEYIAEWLEYHLLIGVDKFYIYDNESTDNLKDVLKPYIDSDIVEYFVIKGEENKLYKYNNAKDISKEQKRWVCTVQLPAYKDAINRMKHETFWGAFIDIDEFIVPVLAKTAPDFLHDYENNVGIEVNWLMYGNSEHVYKNNKLVIERFQSHTLFEYTWNKHTKMIVNPRFVFCQRVHSTWFFEGKKAVTSNNTPPPSIDSYIPLHDKIRINHYHSKSFEEWAERRKGDKTAINNPAVIEEFTKEQAGRNLIQNDTVMLKYIEPVKQALRQRFKT
jgi:hypothetical protein